MFSTLFEYTGKLVGEIVHQTGKAVNDITDIPAAFAKGYEEEMFTASTETPVAPTEEPTKSTIFDDKDANNA